MPADGGAAGKADGVGHRDAARTTREIGAWIALECGIESEGRAGLIALLHRLGMEHRKPKAISRKLDPANRRPSSGAMKHC